MSWGYRQSAYIVTAINGVNHASYVSNVLAGSLLITTIRLAGLSVYPSVFNDNQGNQWVSLVQETAGGGAWVTYYCLSAAAGATTMAATVVNPTGLALIWIIAEYTHTAKSIILDHATPSANYTTATSNLVTSPSIGVTGNDLVIGWSGNVTANATTSQAGPWNVRQTGATPATVALVDQLNLRQGTYTPQVTLSGNVTWFSWSMSFSELAATGSWVAGERDFVNKHSMFEDWDDGVMPS